MRKKLRPLTVFMMKESSSEFEAQIRSPDDCDRMELSDALPFGGAVFIKAAFSGAPWWVPFLQTGTADVLGITGGVTGSAVLFVEAGGRRFAFTFGHGHTMLVPGSYERDFGLRTTLNAVDAQKLRTVDVHTVEELTLHTSRQTSRSSGLEAFGVDVVRDLLRAVRGEPRDQDLARRLGGSDGLRFESAVELPDLGDKCRDLLAMFESESYKTAFAWYDHLRPVSDPAQIAALDERLLAALVGDRQHQPHLAPPEPLDWDSVEGLTFSKQRDSIPGSELELDDYLLAVGDLHELSRDDLHRDRVAEWRTGATRGEERWSVYDCLVFETEADGAVFVLTRGRWFRVDRLFARLVKKRVTSLPQAPIELPNARPDETREDLYNARAARECGLILMDRKTASATGARGQVELCDLMSTDGFFVHVKRWSRSSTLSHLFLQGTVSADTYLSDAGFRKKMRARLKKIDPSYGELIPTEAPDRASIKVVYCVVGKPGGAGTLPFFSQLALDEASRHLGLLGVGVYTRFVGSG